MNENFVSQLSIHRPMAALLVVAVVVVKKMNNNIFAVDRVLVYIINRISQ